MHRFVAEPEKMFILARNYYPIRYKASRLVEEARLMVEEGRSSPGLLATAKALYEKICSVEGLLDWVHLFNLDNLKFLALTCRGLDPDEFYAKDDRGTPVLKSKHSARIEEIYAADREVFEEMFKLMKNYVLF